MWLGDSAEFQRLNGLKAGVAIFQCTAEHLHPRADGGGDHPDNIVAACRHCNWTRHLRSRAQDAAKYRERVKRQVQRGRWLTRQILRTAGG